ncbi:MAG: competence protein ComFB [Oscillospiraceae bacterium]|nr:competence protein ComFB [Oscillospiraceae bacterium]
MGLFKNAMEDIVESLLDREMQGTGCCMCPLCRSDVACYALNRLPPKYMASCQGEMLTRIQTGENQLSADIMFTVSEGCRIVKENPRHELMRLK